MLINASNLASMLHVAVFERDKKKRDVSYLQITERKSDVALYDEVTNSLFFVPHSKTSDKDSVNVLITFTAADKIMQYLNNLPTDTIVCLRQSQVMNPPKKGDTAMKVSPILEVFIPNTETITQRIEATATAQKLNAAYAAVSDVQTKEERNIFAYWQPGYIYEEPIAFSSYTTVNGLKVAAEIPKNDIPRQEGHTAAFILTEQLYKDLAAIKIHVGTDDFKPTYLNPFVVNGSLYATDAYTAAKFKCDLEGTHVIPCCIIADKYIDCKVIYTDDKVILQKPNFLKSFPLEREPNETFEKLAVQIDAFMGTEHKLYTEIERMRFSLGVQISKIFQATYFVVRVGEKDTREIVCESFESGCHGVTLLTDDTRTESNFVFGFSAMVAERILKVAVGDTVLLTHNGDPNKAFRLEYNKRQFLFMPTRVDEDYKFGSEVNESNVIEKTGWRTVAEYIRADKRTFDRYHTDILSDKYIASINNKLSKLTFYNMSAVREFENAMQQQEELQAQRQVLVESKVGKPAKEIKAIDKKIAAVDKQLSNICIPQSFPPVEFCIAHNEANEQQRKTYEQLLKEFKLNPRAFINVPTIAEYYAADDQNYAAYDVAEMENV